MRRLEEVRKALGEPWEAGARPNKLRSTRLSFSANIKLFKSYQLSTMRFDNVCVLLAGNLFVFVDVWKEEKNYFFIFVLRNFRIFPG